MHFGAGDLLRQGTGVKNDTQTHTVKHYFHFHCIFISHFFNVENSLHFYLFPGVDILCRKSYGYGQIPEIRVYLISRLYANYCENGEHFMHAN